MSADVYPLILRPVYKDYIWGGDRIIRTYARPEPPGVYAESWEVSDRPEGASVVANGPLAGRSLAQVVEELGPRLVGEGFEGGRFPLLIKLIDSRQRLSVQVHPDDHDAGRLGAEPKTEAWYVLDADAGARVFAGLRPGVGRDELLRAMADKKFEDVLRSVPVRRGDVIFIPGGRVHAIDAGCLLYEVQQNSNTTYRLYDWDRVGADGKPRPLHIQEALQCIHFDDHDDPRVSPRIVEEKPVRRLRLLETPYFILEKLVAAGAWSQPGETGSFQAFFVEQGSVQIEHGGELISVSRGTSFLLPAALPECRLIPGDGGVELLRVTRGVSTGSE